MMRPSAGYLLSDSSSPSHDDDDNPRTLWDNATAICHAHRVYHGLPETVLQWMVKTFGLGRGVLGKRAPWKSCMPSNNCALGEGGIWHTHNASAVRVWLAAHDG